MTDIERPEGSRIKEAGGMYLLMQYIRDYIWDRPDECREWLKEKAGKEERRDANARTKTAKSLQMGTN